VAVTQLAGRFPPISGVQWLSPKEVLGGEASDFTPWLVRPESMQILGGALKLEDLSAVTAELNVLGKRRVPRGILEL
jgi:hypothetical protein